MNTTETIAQMAATLLAAKINADTIAYWVTPETNAASPDRLPRLEEYRLDHFADMAATLYTAVEKRIGTI